jgi:hypothetical protein
VTTLPRDKSGTALFAGSNLGVFSKSPNVDASVKLLNYLADPATQLSWYKINGELPTVKAALNDPSLANDPIVKVYVQQLGNAKLLPVVAAWDPIGQKMLASLNEIALKGADSQATLAKLNQDVARPAEVTQSGRVRDPRPPGPTWRVDDREPARRGRDSAAGAGACLPAGSAADVAAAHGRAVRLHRTRVRLSGRIRPAADPHRGRGESHRPRPARPGRPGLDPVHRVTELPAALR